MGTHALTHLFAETFSNYHLNICIIKATVNSVPCEVVASTLTTYIS